ncbi:MAG: hypothetical protein ACK56F_12990, partial [bacterium]
MRVELKGLPVNRGLCARILPASQGRFQITFANPAPWADHIGDDNNFDRLFHGQGLRGMIASGLI